MRYFFKLFSNSFIIFLKSKLKPLLVLHLAQVLFFNVVTWKWGKVFNFFLTIGYNYSFFSFCLALVPGLPFITVLNTSGLYPMPSPVSLYLCNLFA